MMPSVKVNQIDEWMEQATEALTHTRYFEAERLCLRALRAARRARDYERLARICLPLQESRRQRLMMAQDARDGITVISTPFDDDFEFQPGCYLIDPLLVAADARRLRHMGLDREIPIAVLAREPLTQTGLQPIASLGEVVVRTKVRPPKNRAQPSLEWFNDAMEALGDAAIDEIDPALKGERLVDALIDRLDAVPEHENLHQRLGDAAREAAHALAEGTP